jgi:hypothetical protein
LFYLPACALWHKPNDELAMVRQVFGQEKKEIVKQFLDLSAADSAKFWPLYDEYSA